MPSNSTSKYKFSRKWYKVENPYMCDEYWERINWCIKNFGAQPKYPDAWCRWHSYLGGINFRDAKDYEWFVLRWS